MSSFFFLRGSWVSGIITVQLVKENGQWYGYVTQARAMMCSAAQQYQLLDAAFQFSCAQRMRDFYAPWPKGDSLLMAQLGYFPAEADQSREVSRWNFKQSDGYLLFHKRSPHFVRDTVLPIPDADIPDTLFSKEALAAASRIAAVYEQGQNVQLEQDVALKLH